MISSGIWTKSFILICFSSFFVFLNFYTLAATLPVIVAQSWHGDQSQIGLTMTVFIVAAVLLRPVAGSLVGSWGPRRTILCALALFLAGSLLYPLVNGMLFLFVLRFLHGSGFGMASTATGAAAADLVPAERKGEGIGYFSLFMSLAMVIGPFIGLTVTAQGSPATLFTLCGAFSMAALLCALGAGLPEPAARSKVRRARGRVFRWQGLVEPAAVPISLAGFVLAFAYSGITNFISVYADELGMAGAAGLFFVCFAAAIVIPRPLVGKLFDRLGPHVIVYPGIALFAAGMLALSRAGSEAGFLTAGAVIGLGYGALLPIFQTIAVLAAPHGRGGPATGTYFLMFDTGYGLGSWLLGLLALHTHYRGVYVAASIIVAFTSICYYFLHHARTRRLESAAYR